MDYKKTLSLPRTKFPMKANLAQREADIVMAGRHSNQVASALVSRQCLPIQVNRLREILGMIRSDTQVSQTGRLELNHAGFRAQVQALLGVRSDAGVVAAQVGQKAE